tara:strand:- start:1415 stop:1942 length:528 start_codon:yes stop_codon:yes gene_type:complete
MVEVNEEVKASDEVEELISLTSLEAANKTSKTYMYAAMGVGLIPVPLVDFAAISLIQLKMVHSLAKHYDIPFSKDVGKAVISSLVGGVLPAPVGMGFASLTKAIPVVGPLIGAASVPLFAGASTYALSRVFIQHFEAGGTFLSFDPEAVRDYFFEQYQKGKSVFKDMKKSKNTVE